MTKREAGILGSLTAEELRGWTNEALAAKAAAIEATDDGDGFMSTADEADLLLINREQERRDNAPQLPASWFLVTARSHKTLIAVILLVQARAGAEVEQELTRHGIDHTSHQIDWSPLNDCRYGKTGQIAELVVVPEVRK